MTSMDTHPVPFPVPLLRGVCERVVDADTFIIACDLAFHCRLAVPVRLRGVNAPELSTEAGRQARDAVTALLGGQPVLLTPYKDRQSFARWIGDVQFLRDDTWHDLAEWLVAAGWAVRR